mgnify:FL=1
MATALIILQFAIVLALIFKGARVGGIGLGISPLALVAMFPAVNGYFFLLNYPTTVAAINFDRTGSTCIGKFVINHSFQLAGFITTFVSIGVGYLIIQFL